MPDLDAILQPGRGYREAVVQAAAGQLGAKDHRIADYWRAALGVEWHGAFPPQWCGAFNLWCLKQAGLAAQKTWTIGGCWPLPGSKGSGFLLTLPMPLETLGHGVAPQPGDTSYKAAPFQHHAIVESVDADGTVHTIDGNQGPPLFIKRASHKLGDGLHTYFSIGRLIDAVTASK